MNYTLKLVAKYTGKLITHNFAVNDDYNKWKYFSFREEACIEYKILDPSLIYK